jgi:hypothetical protein
MKRAISLVKRIGRAYVNSWSKMYGPAIKAGVNPCL